MKNERDLELKLTFPQSSSQSASSPTKLIGSPDRDSSPSKLMNEKEENGPRLRPQPMELMSLKEPVETMSTKQKAIQDSIVNKSRRTKDETEDLDFQHMKDEIRIIKPPLPQYMLYGEWMFLIAQGIVILIYAFCCEYGPGVNAMSESAADGKYDPDSNTVQQLYPVFQDVHVMIFIGFGFLMSFIKTMSWTALAYNWIVSVWALQLGVLTNQFWHQVIHYGELSKIQVSLTNMIIGDFGAGAAMITFGVLLGKCNLQQLIILTTWQMIWWGLNESINVNIIGVSDAGGSILVHTYGAYYGLAACYFFQPNRAAVSKNLKSSYQSEMIAIIGSIFLWMYWPSFNSALFTGAAQHRVQVNTVLAIAGSCLGAAFTARILMGKLEMEIILNATLAGGVAVGSSADLCWSPWIAMLIGVIGGIFSAIGFQKIGPYLSEKINLQDTCGVNSLHGMPGVLAALISSIVLVASTEENFPISYFPAYNEDAIPAMTYSEVVNKQALNQVLALIITLAISICAGLSGGWLCSLSTMQPPHALFRDDDHFHEMVHKYPKSYLLGGDETYEAAKATFDQISKVLKQKRAELGGDADSAIDQLVNEIWNDRHINKDMAMNREETQAFMEVYIKQLDTTIEVSDEAFDQIFKLLDENHDQQISRLEMAHFIKNFSEVK